MADDRSPLDDILEVAVFAPVGLFLAAREAARKELPKLIEAGREQVTKQVALARMMGHYAVEEAQKDAEKRVQQATDLVAAARAQVAPTPPAEPQSATDASASAPPKPEETHPPSPEIFPEATAPLNGSAPDPSVLAIPGYGSLSASQVVPRLAGLSPNQLEAVRSYESSTRGRKTVLGRIAQLQSDAG